MLGSVLLLAGVAASVRDGVLLLAASTGGFAVPFLLLAASAGQARELLRRLAPAMPWVMRGAGVLLAVLGTFVVLDTTSLLGPTVTSAFQAAMGAPPLGRGGRGVRRRNALDAVIGRQGRLDNEPGLVALEQRGDDAESRPPTAIGAS